MILAALYNAEKAAEEAKDAKDMELLKFDVARKKAKGIYFTYMYRCCHVTMGPGPKLVPPDTS